MKALYDRSEETRGLQKSKQIKVEVLRDRKVVQTCSLEIMPFGSLVGIAHEGLKQLCSKHPTSRFELCCTLPKGDRVFFPPKIPFKDPVKNANTHREGLKVR